jgi:hypothetical protein
MAGVVDVSLARAKAEYFSREDWTRQISMKSLKKFVRARRPAFAKASAWQAVTSLHSSSCPGLAVWKAFKGRREALLPGLLV